MVEVVVRGDEGDEEVGEPESVAVGEEDGDDQSDGKNSWRSCIEAGGLDVLTVGKKRQGSRNPQESVDGRGVVAAIDAKESILLMISSSFSMAAASKATEGDRG
jgi:hypothetical protein